MIRLDFKHLLFPMNFLEIKYKFIAKKAMESIFEKYKNGNLKFLDVNVHSEAKRIKKFVEEKKDDYEDIVVLGIGGSALGTEAIFQAIKGKYYNNLSREKRNGFLRLHVLDNVDPIEIDNLLEILDLSQTLFLVISKSGSTLETVSEYHFFKEQVEKRGLDYKKHFTIIAGETSKFKENSLQEGLDVFDVPDGIGGRFSALTNVGLLPLAFTGIDIEALLKGVSNLKNELFESDLLKNKALLTAIIQYHSYIELGKNITIFFPYVSNLALLGKWYQQMMGESLGKGGIGVTLVDSIGVTDQHSQLQLYYDGPNDKLIVFLELEKFSVDHKISEKNDLSFGELMNTEKYGTEQSLSNYNKINYTMKISELKEEALGELIILFEMQTAILGELYGFDPFDQPGVEIGKQITKEKLKDNILVTEVLKKYSS